mmetsp:Transcript_32611/g.93517  ORF Transcript_32611/g.93517 Transcript_32611/m.93517 type:complete len:366 (-) Transcript_32611:1162-2259(-)
MLCSCNAVADIWPGCVPGGGAPPQPPGPGLQDPARIEAKPDGGAAMPLMPGMGPPGIVPRGGPPPIMGRMPPMGGPAPGRQPKEPTLTGGGRGCLGWRAALSSSSFVATRFSACARRCSGPLMRAICGPPGLAAGRTEMWTCEPAFARSSLMDEPPGPISPPTSSAGTCSSRGGPGEVTPMGPPPPLGGPPGMPPPGMPPPGGMPPPPDIMLPCPRPARAGVPAGRAGSMPPPPPPICPLGWPPPPCGGIGGRAAMPCCWGRATPSGQPFCAKASLIICSVFSTSPTMVTLPQTSDGKWSIFTSAPLLWRISWTVSPPLPMSARICMPSILTTLNLDASTPGGGFGSALGMRSCSQSGTFPGSPS